MLKKLLCLATEQSGTINTYELSQRLNLSREQVSAMLEDLARRGYLKSIVQGCPISCARCPWQRACDHKRPPRLWQLPKP
ncbi:FeoC-like transcriptional regulator [Methylococcus sp. ANG]|uniref:FeoC-like transcriptional regulator n=1 Tax=Methylococcus sp. ANG TaxID=3231903 RepID=UPI00345A4176